MAFLAGTILNTDTLIEFMNSIYILSSLLLTGWTWDTFRSIEGAFEIHTPAPMEHTVQQITTDLGDIDFHTYYLAVEREDRGNFFFQVSFYESEALQIPPDSLQLLADFFEATIEQAALSVSGEVVILDDINYQDKYPGRFWRIHYNGGRSVIKTKAYLVKNRFYSVQVAVDADFSLDGDIDRFMNSFKLL